MFRLSWQDLLSLLLFKKSNYAELISPWLLKNRRVCCGYSRKWGCPLPTGTYTISSVIIKSFHFWTVLPSYWRIWNKGGKDDSHHVRWQWSRKAHTSDHNVRVVEARVWFKSLTQRYPVTKWMLWKSSMSGLLARQLKLNLEEFGTSA